MYSPEAIEAEEVLGAYDGCKLILNNSPPVDCRIKITNFRLNIFVKSPMPNSANQCTWSFKCVPLCTVQSLEKKLSYRGLKSMGIIIVCKDVRIVKLILSDSSKGLDAYRQLHDLVFPAVRSRELFAYAFGRQCLEKSRFVADGWDVYDATAEYHRQNIVNNGWRISTVNEDYSFCDTYPSLLAVPVEVSDDLLIQAAPHRANLRVPVLSWLHPESRASLTRASQPMVGLQNRRNSADEQLIELIRKANANTSDLLILDARSQRFALANVAKGGGVENVSHYRDITCKFMGIQNIHAMRASQTKFMEACYSQSDKNWFKMIHESQWLLHLRLLLLAAKEVAEQIENHKRSVLVHCSDGWDRTAQITSLAMIMLDPFYRSIRGFQVLIEKEWVSFGHKFCQRTGGPADGGSPLPSPLAGDRSPLPLTRSSSEERSPIFLQFIDCVWQITQQFSGAFEFNESLLITIMDELYAARFGTFLFDCERQSRVHKARRQTVSLWAYINANRHLYENPTYVPAESSGHRVILPNHSVANLRVWIRYFLRWDPSLQCQEPVAVHNASLLKKMEKFRSLRSKHSQNGVVRHPSTTT
ncbi:Myotubularin-related protein 2 [Sparganum proliferum]